MSFALFAVKHWFFLGQYSTLESWDCKNAVLSQKNNPFKPKQAKMLYFPKTTKNKQSFETLDAKWPGGLQTLVVLVFLGQYRISALLA